MRRTFTLAFLLIFNSLSATYIFTCDEGNDETRLKLFELVLKGEPPRTFHDSTPFNLESECLKLAPPIHLKWIPPTLWQIAVLHCFFFDQKIQDSILACLRDEWDPISYDESIHPFLASNPNLEEIASYFDCQSRSLPRLQELFFQINQTIVALYERANSSDTELLHLILSEIPSFEKWPERRFPFWKSPWIYNLNSAGLFYRALKDEQLLSKLLEIEHMAHKNGEWVLYRGYPGAKYPSTLQKNHTSSHALSFGSTLLGGAFFSLESSALTYAKTDSSEDYNFLALRVTPQELKEFFRIGPLHPLIQMLADGEMFHAHTKIAISQLNDLHPEGYFMKCNQHFNDPAAYLSTLKMTPQELEEAFYSICKKSGYVF